MGIWSWLFPTEADHLRAAKALMAEGRHEKARGRLMRCSGPEVEALYDECSAALDLADRARTKERLAARGFHGWKVEVDVRSARRKKELEALVREELRKAGVDLDLPDLDRAAVEDAFARAERRAGRPGGRGGGSVRLVPIVDTDADPAASGQPRSQGSPRPRR